MSSVLLQQHNLAAVADVVTGMSKVVTVVIFVVAKVADELIVVTKVVARARLQSPELRLRRRRPSYWPPTTCSQDYGSDGCGLGHGIQGCGCFGGDVVVIVCCAPLLLRTHLIRI